MIIHNAGYQHSHDADFCMDRPCGSGDYLLLLLKSATIFILQGKEVAVPENSIFLYRKGTPQHYRSVPRQIFVHDWVHFLFEVGEEAAFLALDIPYDTPLPMENLQFLSFCVNAIAHAAYGTARYRQEKFRHYMCLLFYDISEQLHPAPQQIFDNTFALLSTIRNELYSHPYRKCRTVESAARELRMSPSSFQHLYKKHFGVSFLQDAIDSRMEYAKMLLLHSDMTALEIAGQCGYNHYAHFCRQFKAKTNMTPLAYRRQGGDEE